MTRQRRNAVLKKRSPPVTSRGRATRERLKTALKELLQRHAFNEIRLEDIANLAEVPVSLIYHYFRSKTDITYEVLSELLQSFESDITKRSRDEGHLDAIHYANRRMVALYASNPGSMRCMLEAHGDLDSFSRMWRDLTLEWNRRIARSLARQFPNAFGSETEYLAIAYALAGAVDNYLYEYYVLGNSVLREAHPTDDELARFLSTMWCRALYMRNPPADFLKGHEGIEKIGQEG